MAVVVRLALSFGLVLLALAGTAASQPWPTSGLVLRTNGSSFREGECVRVAVLALEDVTGPLVPRTRYAFNGPVTQTDPQGQPRTVPVTQAVDRPAGVTLERLDAGAAAVLDDTFCFGVGSVAGPYEITVSLASGNTTAGTLTTCVEFQPASAGSPPPASARCAFALRGVSRHVAANVLTLEGQWPHDGSGLFRLVFLRGDRVLSLLEGGLVPEGPGELVFVVPDLGAEGAGQVDLLLQDQWGGRAATLSGISLLR